MWAAGLCIAAVLPQAAAAHSGGSTELLAQLVLHPTDPSIMVARYEAGSAGLLYSDDGGGSFRMLCAGAIGEGADRGTHMGMAGDGKVLIATFNGVSADDGAGCDWTAEPSLEALWVRQLVRHPTDPDTLFAVTGTGVEGTLNALAMRGPDGVWSDLGAREPLLITGLAVATLPAGGGCGTTRAWRVNWST